MISTITEISKGNHALRVCKNSKSRITLLGQITPHAVKLTTPENTITYALCLSPQNFGAVSWVRSRVTENPFAILKG